MPNSKVSRTTPETQAESAWSPPAGVLGELVAAAVERTSGSSRFDLAPALEIVPSLEAALFQDHLTILAEIKRSSPSKGEINPLLDSGEQASAYEKGGASAISVLTEPSRFGGSVDDIRRVRAASGLPILRKDFIVAESQLVEARNAGASAALLIVRALAPARLVELATAAREIGIEVLFEIRDEAELERAVSAGARIIGVNNRNLETLVIDESTVDRILPSIPRECIAVAESGYFSRETVTRAAASGADAVLIGSSLSASINPEASVRELTGIRKASRG